MKTIGITGGTGFVGQRLARLLGEEGYNVIIFSRTPNKSRKYIKNTSYAEWYPDRQMLDLTYFGQVDAMVNLAGAGIADKPWTKKRKELIRNSRVDGTNFLVSSLRDYSEKCKVLISASAIGYYGPDKTGHIFTEQNPASNDFLGSTCREWENAALKAEQYMRTAIFRIGIVLGNEGGALHEFAKYLNMGIMPILGSGSQIVSWIHIHDLARMIRFAVERVEVSGIYNAVAPKPVTHSTLMHTLARIKGGVKIPVPVPSFAVKMLKGEMAEEVLKSTNVSAEKILRTGFSFRYNNLEDAIQSLFTKKK